jgi:AcrR family transcriptional regulator
MNSDDTRKPTNTRDRIVRAAATLLELQGRDAVSTRAVADAAQVQVPTIYRLFGDMHGLLDAVVSYGFTQYFDTTPIRISHDDPVEDLRQGWDGHVEFGLANPEVYRLMYAEARRGDGCTAVEQALHMLSTIVERIAQAGRLRLGVGQSVQMLQAGCRGITLSLLEAEPDRRDLALSSHVREAILNAITLPAEESVAAGTTLAAQERQSRVTRRAVALKAVLPEVVTLTPGEQLLLGEWLDRLSRSSPEGTESPQL